MRHTRLLAVADGTSNLLAPTAPPSALATLLQLVLAVFKATRRFPANDPFELERSVRGAALSAAEAVLAHSRLRRRAERFHAASTPPSEALVEAKHRLRELACCIGIARRLGYLESSAAAEVLEWQARAVHALAGEEG